MQRLHINSFKCCQIEILAERTKASLGFATGFLCIYKKQLFLVTNWHVATGRNFQTKKIMHNSGAVPGYFNLTYAYSYSSNKNDTLRMPHFDTIEDFPLYKDEDYIDSWYLVHPIYDSQIDVIAIPIRIEIEGTENYEILCIDIEEELKKNTKIGIMDTVFIVGYPLETALTPNKFPIYKYGTVASEPDFYRENLPK
jgi:hypothetical protein